MFSISCKYALRAVIMISSGIESSAGRPIPANLIVKKADLPRPFMMKMLQHLVRGGVISSRKGPGGGFYMTKENKAKFIKDIILAMEGDKMYTECVMGLKQCQELNPCPLHDSFKPVRRNIIKMIETRTLGELGEQMKLGNVFLRLE